MFVEKLFQTATRIQAQQLVAKAEIYEHRMPASIFPGWDHETSAF
jgi:hypothetical protein